MRDSYSDNTWKEHVCTECSEKLGHCPMKFYTGSRRLDKLNDDMDVCLCHRDYNHCIASNENGEIPGGTGTLLIAFISASYSRDRPKLGSGAYKFHGELCRHAAAPIGNDKPRYQLAGRGQDHHHDNNHTGA